MTKYFTAIIILLSVFIGGCDKQTDCGDEKLVSTVIYNSDFFTHPSEIYWGTSDSIRSYTYNWTFADICTKKNPKVDFLLELGTENNKLSHPFSFDAGTATCLGVQAQKSILSPSSGQTIYESTEAEIGMQQCFSGQSSASIYPYIVVSFTTLGSSEADSIYLVDNLNFIKATVNYNAPK